LHVRNVDDESLREPLDDGLDAESAFRRAVGRLEGSYAVAMLVEGRDEVFATRQDSPLVLGIGEQSYYLASDVPAFLEFTDRVVYLEDGDVAIVEASDYHVTDSTGTPVQRPVESVEWDSEAVEKGSYDHFMLKEIQEQPTSLRQTIEGRIDGYDIALEDLPPGAFTDVQQIHLVACGTSYHAGVYGERLLADWGVAAQTFLASEYAHHPPPIDNRTLVIGVTQSGETADTLAALRVARDAGGRTLALTNVIGSTAARECDDSLFIRAGPEIGVAATKTFSSQIATLVLLSERLARDVTGTPSSDHQERLAALEALPDAVESILQTDDAELVARNWTGTDAYFFIGRGCAYPVALEGALKFKEITYEHAEAFAAGELKHGPLALVTQKTPVFAISTGRNQKMLRSTIREIQTRRAPVIAVGPRTESDILETADDFIPIPGSHPDLVPLLANIQLQLIAYHAAASLGRSIDKPRNLAKSVTVE